MPRHPPNALKSLDRSHYRDPDIRYQMSRQTSKTRSPYPLQSPVLGRTKDHNQIARWKNLYCAFNLSDMARSSTITRGSRASQTNPSFTMSISSRATLVQRRNRFHKAASAKIQAKAGGARRDRTDDLKLAKLALSQLSYGPGQSSVIRYQ